MSAEDVTATEHLLDDLEAELAANAEQFDRMAGQAHSDERARLFGRAEGVRLALDCIWEARR